ncbi:MAG: isochorismatase family protein [Psychromonas sp.]|nr:isochorismatase family protein [Psychromonas sp.]
MHDHLINYRFATKKSLRVLLPQKTRVINKHGYNAFTGTNLSQLLAQQYQCKGVENLVVMGFNSNICVAATIGPEYRNGKNYQLGLGAVDHNLTVLTCQQILTGEDAWWTEHSPLIKFYSHL